MSTADLSPRRRRRRFLVGYDEEELAVKGEPEEDIKDYAETTMNELLGWYGYEKVDSRDTQGLNLTHFASNNPTGGNNNNSDNNSSNNINNPPNGISPPSSAIEGSDGSEDVVSHHEASDGLPTRIRSDSASPGPDVSSTASDEVARQHQQMVSALSSVTKHPGAPDSPNLPPGCIICAWCQKVGMKLFTLKTPNGCKAFCSELCFTQCRRASFKKNKICDWCKHVRHTVNYVDFQDGEQQLQFCSDKCLNQYKMNIFCKETQAHLQMHTHLKEAACKMKASGSVNLITPELWLRDCKMNGMPTSPLGSVDNADDIISDDNLSAAPSPTLVLESSRPNTPVLKEKKEQKQDLPPPLKERDKPSKKSSKHSPKKSSPENKPHHSNRHHRDKKLNGMQYTDAQSLSRHSPIHASPTSHTRSSQMTNGTPSLLSPPPLPITRPPHHVGGPLPPRHCPPPVPSPLGMAGFEPGRQPFMHPNMMPPPFQFLAQQQMEAFLRSQHGLDLRAKAPPHMPMPPWVMPPFPPMHPQHQPPIPPHLSSSKSPSLPHPSPPTRTHHLSSSHKSNHHHHSKHKHSKRFPGKSIEGASQSTPSVPIPDPTVQLPPSLLPPVTVMVPFPLVLPIPLPIPVPLPIPPDVMEKYRRLKLKESEAELKNSTNTASDYSNRKRKVSRESPKRRKIRKDSTSESFALNNTSLNCEPVADANIRVHPNDRYYDQVENLSIRATESLSVDFNESPKVTKIHNDTDLESRSYSPLSEALSSNDDEENIPRTLKSRDRDSFSIMNFSTYNLNMRSSPSVNSQASDRQSAMNSVQEFLKSPSPTNLSVRERLHSNASSNSMNFKKKHLREQLSLMT